ncbi:MAG: TetR/AcrR family transcriptional regulator [Acidobacteriota bacterium]|jgi:AcrR family transcriptional regulator
MATTARKRRYRKKQRARQEAETRRRITEAVMELHRTVGPANTTVTEVAELAGVGRQTVYNHFPTEGAMIEACATRWASLNPLPAPDRWSEIEDPEERLDDALSELYSWYAETEDMMGKILRDAPIVEPLGELMEQRWFALVEAMVETLTDAEGGELRRAAVRVAIDFATWRSLRDSGLSDRRAADLAAGFVRSACADRAQADPEEPGRIHENPETLEDPEEDR